MTHTERNEELGIGWFEPEDIGGYETYRKEREKRKMINDMLTRISRLEAEVSELKRRLPGA